MQKLILTLALLVSSAAAPASPISMLVQQCRSLPVYEYTNKVSHDGIDNELTVLEDWLISLFNFTDRVKYLTQNANAEQKQQLLLCQVYLGDLLEHWINTPQTQTFIDVTKQSAHSHIKELASKIDELQTQQLTAEMKAQLYTAQAAYRHSLRQPSMQLKVPYRCQIKSLHHDKQGADKQHVIDVSIARYLLNQNNANCRAEVWQAYQKRASVLRAKALETIEKIWQKQATKAGYQDYSRMILADQFIESPDKAMAFLNSQTHNIKIAPWDIGPQLKSLAVSDFEPLSASGLVHLLQPALSELGLTLEQPTGQSYRLWHQQRLLGEWHLIFGNKSKSSTLRHPVIGRQFGTVMLSTPEVIANAKQLHSFIQQLSATIVILSTGQPHYLLSSNTETKQIASDWLANWLHWQMQQVLPQPNDLRFELMQTYRQQLRVFRAKLALTHAGSQTISEQTVAAWFQQSFGTTWPNAIDALNGFTALVEVGPSYYRSLWYSVIASLIFEQSQCCISAKQVFNTVVINHPYRSLPAQLNQVFGDQVDADYILERIRHD